MGRSISWYLLKKKNHIMQICRLQISSIHSPFPHSIPIYYAGWVVYGFCNDTARIKYDFFLWLKGGNIQGHALCQSGAPCTSGFSEPRSSQIWSPALQTPPVFLLSLCLLCVCLLLCVLVCACRWFLWFLSRFSSDISGLAQLTPNFKMRVRLKFG